LLVTAKLLAQQKGVYSKKASPVSFREIEGNLTFALDNH